jgi:hypothetical protein
MGWFVTRTSDACQPDTLTTHATAHYQCGDVEGSVLGSSMQLGHPGWYGDGQFLNSKGLLKRRGSVPNRSHLPTST